jgi:vancomycin aglycone glucosyltransferase
MRVALAVEGTRGDVYPMIALAEALADSGHVVRVCAPPDFRAPVEERGWEFRSVGGSVRETLAAESEALTRGGLALLRASDRYARDSLAAQFATLPAATEGADWILAAGVQFAARTAAELHGVPFRYVAYCPVLLPSGEYPPPVVQSQTLPAWANRALWRLMIVAWNLNAGPRPVYLGFGSMTDPRPQATTRALLEAVSALGRRALISRGWAGLGDGPLPEGVFAVGSVSHARPPPRPQRAPVYRS